LSPSDEDFSPGRLTSTIGQTAERKIFPIRGQFHQQFYSKFYTHRSQKHKIKSSCQYLFALLGSAQVKDAHKMLMKLTPDRVCHGSIYGAIQKIRVKKGGREGSSDLTQNDTVGEGGVCQFNT